MMTSAVERPILSDTGPDIAPPKIPPIGPIACKMKGIDVHDATEIWNKTDGTGIHSMGWEFTK